MAATATYSALLKRFTPEQMFENEFNKYSYIWSNCEKDKSWRGGTYEVPLFEAGFSTMQMGALAAAADIAEMDGDVGTTSMKEMWSSFLVRESDIFRHADREQSYLEIMPKRVQEFVMFQQSIISSMFLSGRIAKLTANGHASNGIVVDKIANFRKGMKVAVDDDNSSEVVCYVRTIDINTKTLVLYDARSGGSVVDLSGYTTAQNAIVRLVGAGSENFTTLPQFLLSAADGGTDTLYGKTRASYTSLQSLVKSGASYTAETILDDLLTDYYDMAETRPSFKQIWVCNAIFKNISKVLTTTQRATITDKKAGYGFSSVSLVGNGGECEIIGLKDMPADKVYLGDVKNIKFAGAEPFKRKMYNGEEFFMVRGTTGPEYISDMALRGDYIVKPAEFGVIHSVAAAAAT